MLRAKIHRITATEANVQYEGSLTLDADLMDACDMVPYERIDAAIAVSTAPPHTSWRSVTN
jgi:aspartate 1-decarboxylase